MRKRLIALSLFSGAGGMDFGVSQAGFEFIAHIESDPHCCETLRTAFAAKDSTPRIMEMDVREVNPTELMAAMNLRPGDLDLLVGGPPCQAFSQIGKQQSIGDERGLLIFQMLRFAEVLKPKTVLIEQVKGFLTAKDLAGTKGGVFQALLDDLERLEYLPKWRVINAADYGVPQLRRRVFIVATKKPDGFEFPAPTHTPSNRPSLLFPLPPYETVGHALKGLGPPSNKQDMYRTDSHVDVTPDGDRSRIHGVPEGAYLAGQLHLPDRQRGNLTKKDTTKFLRVSRDKQSKTLRCGEIFFHPHEDRYLTPRECMRIHGYPDDYRIMGPIRSRSGRVRNLDQHRQVANSVPPPVALAIAEEIEKDLECRKSLRSSVTR